jgi:hypothetical protein
MKGNDDNLQLVLLSDFPLGKHYWQENVYGILSR